MSLDALLALAALTAVLMLALGRHRWAGWLGLALYAGQLVILVGLGRAIASGGPAASGVEVEILGQPLVWEMTGLGFFFALITLVAALFSAWYAAGEWGRAQSSTRGLHAALALNVLAMLILVSSGELLSLFIGWELVSWASYLIMLQGGPAAREAAFRYLMYALSGAMLILAALVWIWVRAGSLDYAAAGALLAAAGDGSVWAIMGLLGAGFAIKMALVPFHLWQADAYAETPGPAAAFLGAISSRMGLFALLVVLLQLIGLDRLTELTVPLTLIDARGLWATIAAITIVVPTFIALQQTDARLLLAWHGIGQGGYMLLGVLIGNDLGSAGGLMHVINHASYQAPLFLSVAAVVHRTGTADLDRLGGLITRMPLSYVTMLIGIIGLAGLPPMNGFVSKWLIYKGLLEAHMPLLFVAAVIGTLGTILSVYKLIHNTFLGQLRAEHLAVREAPWSMTLPMLGMSAIVFVTGWFPGLLLDLVGTAQSALGLPVTAHSLGGVSTPTGSLNMIWVVSALLGMIGVGALIFLAGGRRRAVGQLDNYAGGHFLTAEVRYHYSHDFYPGLNRVILPWYRGSIAWIERGIGNLVGVLGTAAGGWYRSVYSPLYLLAAAVLGVGLFALGI